MSSLLLGGGKMLGLLGIALMIVSVASRLTGRFTVGDFQIGTPLIASISAVSAGCFLLLWSIADRKLR